ncbi:MAG: FeoA family protein [Chloroflexi bacterium]|nr:FeoA family protein [Chloroflexota bacterium]
MSSVFEKISLNKLSPGEQGTVLSFTDDRLVTNRLASLGFTPGVVIDMTQNYGHGPLIVTVRGTRVALGRDEAARIFVQQGQV